MDRFGCLVQFKGYLLNFGGMNTINSNVSFQQRQQQQRHNMVHINHSYITQRSVGDWMDGWMINVFHLLFNERLKLWHCVEYFLNRAFFCVRIRIQN